MTLQARAIVDLEARIAELEARRAELEASLAEEAAEIQARDDVIVALRERIKGDEELLGVYRRSRAVRAATFLKRLQPGSRNGAV
ncbi:MAG: hypothetical protein JOZ75_14330 [Candidatus Dormibacteraeota bacterium]|nr:hypothetical protein [Candidatus Dormibacteraeota bacterium]